MSRPVPFTQRRSRYVQRHVMLMVASRFIDVAKAPDEASDAFETSQAM